MPLKITGYRLSGRDPVPDYVVYAVVFLGSIRCNLVVILVARGHLVYLPLFFVPLGFPLLVRFYWGYK
jgi:hypothetical protein